MSCPTELCCLSDCSNAIELLNYCDEMDIITTQEIQYFTGISDWHELDGMQTVVSGSLYRVLVALVLTVFPDMQKYSTYWN